MSKYMQMAKDAEARRLLSELQKAGYSFTLEGEIIRFAWAAEGKPDRAVVLPKLERLKELKPEAARIIQQQEKVISFEEAKQRIRG